MGEPIVTERTPLVGGAERARLVSRRAASGLVACACFCMLAMVQLGSQPSSPVNLRPASTDLAEQSEQGFFSALMTSGSFTMMQAGSFAEELDTQSAGAAAYAARAAPPRGAQTVCADACKACDVAAVIAACDSVVPQPHDAASEAKDLQLADSCAAQFGCSDCLLCHEQHSGLFKP